MSLAQCLGVAIVALAFLGYGGTLSRLGGDSFWRGVAITALFLATFAIAFAAVGLLIIGG